MAEKCEAYVINQNPLIMGKTYSQIREALDLYELLCEMDTEDLKNLVDKSKIKKLQKQKSFLENEIAHLQSKVGI